MTPAARRRRALVLAGLALLLGGLAASDVAGREAALSRRLGPTVPVVVARTPLAANERVDPRALAVRHVPARFAPRGAFAAPPQLAGQRLAADIPAGADVTASSIADPAAPPAGAPVTSGQRVAEVVAAGPPDVIVAGARVDVLVTREPRPGAPGGTDLALQDVEVLAAVPAPADSGPPRIAASLRVTLRQAVYLAAAQSFARELRLLPRAHGDHRRAEPLTYGAGLG
ncbi:MAG TPA: SAF domain-containing protein [Solirubrobacteraceae bacterium]|jgi:pilus assembly protein CpaB|nr:SAF domain-containing protein [Solirubrobacteraceae bacterium]